MEALRPLFDHQKLTFMLIAAGVPKKLNQDLVKCDTDEEDSVAYHTILTLFALVSHFYRELSQLMDDCTGRQSAHKLRALKPHPRHSSDISYKTLDKTNKCFLLFVKGSSGKSHIVRDSLFDATSGNFVFSFSNGMISEEMFNGERP